MVINKMNDKEIKECECIDSSLYGSPCCCGGGCGGCDGEDEDDDCECDCEE